MEDSTTSFFINGLKVHIESSINKYEQYEDNKCIIFDEDFENKFLNPIFINNILLFGDIITQNNLNYEVFWIHIGKTMAISIESLLQKFEEKIKKEKENIKEENNLKIEIGNKNILKLKILNICFFLLTNENLDNFQLIKNNDKEKFKNLLELYIKLEIENNIDFSLFIKNYIVKMTLLINDNYRRINIGFLKFLSFTCYNFECLFMNKEQMNNLKIYIDQTINNPRRELNNYLNGALNKKNYKKDKLNRSRGASFDLKDANINNNNNIEKNNKKIEDFFKTTKKEKNENNNSNENLGRTKDSEKNLLNNNKESELSNLKKESNQCKTQGKLLHFSSHASNLSLFNLNSGFSNHSNSFLLNNSFSFSKNNNINNSKISLDDSLSLTGIFSTPISELKENEENKKFLTQFPSILKCVQKKKKKPFERLKDNIFRPQQMNIKKYMTIDTENKENDEIKELRNVVNSSFYGNENDENDGNSNNINKKNKKIDKNKKEILKNNEKIKNNKIKDGNILIYKTPNKNDKENKDENIKENIDINAIKKNWELLFAQKAGI